MMATYVVHESRIDVIGRLWVGSEGATSYKLDSFDVRNCATEDGELTRDSVERYLMLHSGDFASVTDFSASIWDGTQDHDFPWASEESELAFNDCMYPSED